MSPMTRIRASEDCVPTERMIRYYAQRASAGMIITEGTHLRPFISNPDLIEDSVGTRV